MVATIKTLDSRFRGVSVDAVRRAWVTVVVFCLGERVGGFGNWASQVFKVTGLIGRKSRIDNAREFVAVLRSFNQSHVAKIATWAQDKVTSSHAENTKGIERLCNRAMQIRPTDCDALADAIELIVKAGAVDFKVNVPTENTDGTIGAVEWKLNLAQFLNDTYYKRVTASQLGRTFNGK